MRVFLDTKVLVSAFLTRGICEDVVNVVLAEHQLGVGESEASLRPKKPSLYRWSPPAGFGN